MHVIAVLRAGVIGETMLSGLLRSGRAADTLLIAEKRPARAAQVRELYGVEVVDPHQAAARADTLLLVVKPQDMGSLLDSIAGDIQPHALVVSLAAGVTTTYLEARLPEGTSVVRVMPNTPALVDEGMAALSPGQHCSDDQLAHAEELLSAVGKTRSDPGAPAGRRNGDLRQRPGLLHFLRR